MRLNGRTTRVGTRRAWVRTVGAFAVLAMVAAACGGGEESSDSSIPPEEGGSSKPDDGGPPSGEPSPGVTDDKVVVSFSGPISAFGDFYTKLHDAGTGVWLNEVNANGGVNGRQVEIKLVDNQLTPDGAIAACEEAKGNGSLFVVIAAGYSSEASCLEDAGIPSLVNLVDEVDPDWVLVHYLASVRLWGSTMADLVKKATPDAKVGVLFLRDLAYGMEAKAEFMDLAEEYALDVVAEEGIATAQASYVAELQRLKSAGAETVVLFVTTDAIGVLRDAESIHFEPQFTGTGFIIDTIAQAVRDPMMGVLGVRSTSSIGSAAYDEYVAAEDKYGDEETTPSADGMGGYGMGLIVQAVLEAGGEDLTRDSLQEGFKSIDGLDTGGIYPPVSWADGAAGTDTAFEVVCCNEDFTWKPFEGG